MQKPSCSYRVRLLKKEEIPKVLQLCKAEGRHMGLQEEVESWFQFDPNGFFIAVSDDDQILGSCAGIRLSDFHGNVGMYVVQEAYRGTGIGKQIWNAAISHLGSRNKGLSAVSALLPVYRDKAGFSHIADWTVDLYKLEDTSTLCKQLSKSTDSVSAEFAAFHQKSQRRLITNSDHTLDINTNRAFDNENQWKLSTTLITKELIQDVIAYDFSLHFYDRSKIIALTLNEKNCRSRVAFRGGKVVGYGCLKPNLQGLWMLSPLYADDEEVARQLFCDLLSTLSPNEQKSGVVLKSPSNNQSAISLLKSFGFEKQTYSLRRCYTQNVYNVPTHHIFAFHSSVFCSE